MSPGLEGEKKSMILSEKREGASRSLESDSWANKVSETAQEKITAINFTARENGPLLRRRLESRRK